MKSVRFKILAMLGIVALGAILSAGLSLFAMAKIDALEDRASNQGDVALLTERLNGLVIGVVMDSRGIYMADTQAAAEPFAKGLEARFPQIRQIVADLAKRVEPTEIDRVNAIKKGVEEFIAHRSETVRLSRQVSVAAATAQGNNEENRANRKALNDDLTNFTKRVDAAGSAFSEEAANFTDKVQTILPIGLAISLLVSFGIAVLLSNRSITAPILALSKVMEGLTNGETNITVPHVKRQDEIGVMARAVAVLGEATARIATLQAEERANTERRIKQAESMASVVADVGEVVAAAAAGDFSARLEVANTDPEMQKLVSGINEINSVVDSATTEFAQVLHFIANGDLTHRIDTSYRGRFADLKGSINETIEKLASVVGTIQVTAGDVGVASREINAGATDLSQRTEDQASSLEETAATTEELAASVKASAQASRQAAVLAEEAKAAAETGGTIADQAVEAMSKIETATGKISEIIRVIDDIAFQTNLLALNAAVEAARAGDAGRGFAVVASEVRTLAQRSSVAAKEITALINSSNDEVATGAKLVRKAGDSLNEILDASRKVAVTIAEISTATGEQANGLDEMSHAVAHLDEMTQQNAALAEQSAASATSLTGRIGQLNDLVAAFRTDNSKSQAPEFDPGVAAHQLRELASAAAASQRRHPPKPPLGKKAANSHSSSGWEEF